MKKSLFLMFSILLALPAAASEVTFEGIPLSGTAAQAKAAGFQSCKTSGLANNIVCDKPIETTIGGEKIDGLQILLEKNGTYKWLYIKRKPENNLNFALSLEKDGWIESGRYSHTREYFKKDSDIKIQITGHPADADISQIEIMEAELENREAALKRAENYNSSKAATNSTLEFMNKK